MIFPRKLATCLIVVVSCALTGCQRATDVTIVISGDTAGWITPCGCTSGQSGGLARRASLIESLRGQQEVLVLDVGGAAGGSSAYDLVKLKAILSGQQQMGLNVFNLGTVELSFGPEEVRRWNDALKIPIVSANLRDQSQRAVAPGFRVIDINGRRFAVAGVIDPAFVSGDHWIAEDPVTALVDLFRKVEADHRIVLAYADETMLKELARQLPEVDAVIGGPTGQIVPPDRVGPVWVGSATNKGKYLLQLHFSATGNTRAEVAEVVSTLPEDPGQLDNLKAFYQQCAQADFAPADTTWGSSGNLLADKFAIAGSAACQKCHELDMQSWYHSKHAAAWQALQPTGAFVDPACQRCHTTGYGANEGFTSLRSTLELVHVGCESCHGPSAAHVQDPRVRTPYRAFDQCLQCHDEENSPSFHRELYWTRIIHGKESAVSDPPHQSAP